MAEVEIKEARIDKIVRTNGKKEASMQVTIPAGMSADVQLGDVSITIKPKQLGIFGKPAKGKILGKGGDKAEKKIGRRVH